MEENFDKLKKLIFTISTNDNIIVQREWELSTSIPNEVDLSKVVTLIKLYLKTRFHK